MGSLLIVLTTTERSHFGAVGAPAFVFARVLQCQFVETTWSTTDQRAPRGANKNSPPRIPDGLLRKLDWISWFNRLSGDLRLPDPTYRTLRQNPNRPA